MVTILNHLLFMILQLVTLKIKRDKNLQNKNTRTTIARMFDNYPSNYCCYHIEEKLLQSF